MELLAKKSSIVSPTWVPAGTATEWLLRLPLVLFLPTNVMVSESLDGLAVLVMLAVAFLLSVTVRVTGRSPAAA